MISTTFNQLFNDDNNYNLHNLPIESETLERMSTDWDLGLVPPTTTREQIEVLILLPS